MNDEVSRARIALVGPMPPTKGGITTFMLNLMSSYLAEEFEFVPYTITRPPKPYVVDNYGYGAVLRGGLRRVSLGIGLTALRLFQFPQFVLRNSIDLVQVHASDYQSFWEGVAYILLGRALRRPTVLRLGGHFDHFHQNSGPFGRRLIGWALQISNVLIVQSQFTADYVKQCGRERRVIVLSNWVPNELLTSRQPKKHATAEGAVHRWHRSLAKGHTRGDPSDGGSPQRTSVSVISLGWRAKHAVATNFKSGIEQYC